jgi:predicted AlkP superfamily pyrophosphatase or phosphodiesterase
MPKLKLCFFIDALGWEILQAHSPFLEKELPFRKPLETIFGYSSACDPSIISGRLPYETGHFSSFYYSPETSPFRWTKWLRFLPKMVTDWARVRHHLSKWIGAQSGIMGYFQVYQMPFRYLPLFDWAEKKRIWQKGGLVRGRSIFDELEERGIPYYVGDLDAPSVQLEKLEQKMREGNISFAYLLFGQLDALMHGEGPQSPKIKSLLATYEKNISAMIKVATQKYEDIDIYCFSDHGMHAVKKSYDLQRDINLLGMQYGVDYVAVYDSTMARFWYLNDKAEKKICALLARLECGKILSRVELERFGTYFPDHKYGKTFFLMNSGVLIVPSFMTLKQIPGMHGYLPSDKESKACIMSNKPLPDALNQIHQIYSLWKDLLCS